MSKQKKNIEELLEEIMVPEGEQPYPLPVNWCWVKLGKVVEVKRGASPRPKGDPKYFGGNIPWLKISDVTKQGKYVYETEDTVTEAGRDKSVWVEPDTLILSISASVGRPCINKVGVCIHDGFVKLSEDSRFINKLYLYYYLISSLNQMLSKAKGAAQVNINSTIVKELPIPLPSLDEQKRIAEKMEGLLTKIEEAKQLIEEAKETFELRRAAILDKAFRGEMTAKWRKGNQDVDSVRMLLEKIKNERSKEKGRKKVTEIKEVTAVPYKLPKGWEWIDLGCLLEEKGIFDGPFGSNLKTADYTESGIRVIRLENIRRLSFDDSKRTYISHEKYNNLKKHTLMKGDIIFSSFISENVRVCILPDMEAKAINKADCFCIRPNIRTINKEFLLYFLSSNVCYNFLHRQIHGATRPRVNTTQLKSLPIPVPPLKEQFEIITHIQKLYKAEEEAFNYLNLEHSIAYLKQSILFKAFRGELGTNDPSEESAIELLKEVLQEQVK